MQTNDARIALDLGNTSLIKANFGAKLSLRKPLALSQRTKVRGELGGILDALRHGRRICHKRHKRNI